MAQWVDFKRLRQDLSFEKVLHAYGVGMHIKETAEGRQHVGCCPLPDCLSQSETFSANVDKGIWQCFRCKAKGNLIDFGVRMEGFNPEDPGEFRQGALLVQTKCLDKRQPQKEVSESRPKEKKRDSESRSVKDKSVRSTSSTDLMTVRGSSTREATGKDGGLPQPKFPLGNIVMTPNALESVSSREMILALARHVQGDWGEVGEEDRRENEFSLKKGFRLLSVYRTSSGVKFWIITEADRSVTTVLLPQDY